MAVSRNARRPVGRFWSKTLTDVEEGIYLERWSISSDELGIGEKWCVDKRRLRGGLSDGVDIITVSNGELSFVVVPTRGMGVWKGEYKGVFLGWESPVKELVNPQYLNLEARGGLGWLDGFNEWVVRCGLGNFGGSGFDVIKDNTGRKKKVMLTLHGKIANIPASVVRVKIGLNPPFELGVEGVVHERAMFGTSLRLTTAVTTTLGSNSLKISDAIENLRGVTDEMQILYHCNYGHPFLEEGARLVGPIKLVAPRNSMAAEGIDNYGIFGPSQSGFVEQVYFMELLADSRGRTKTMLVGKYETKAVSVSFSVKELPCFTLWKNTAALEDGYVTGLEPGTSFPNPKPFERQKNRVIRLKPGEKYCSEVVLSAHLGKDEVQKVYSQIEKIRGKTKPVVLRAGSEFFSCLDLTYFFKDRRI